MIPFFRKIRQNLSAEGKTRRYLKYALGEILLIIIGIVAALELQNWNEGRQQEMLFKTSLEQFYNALYEEINTYNLHLESYGSKIGIIEEIMTSRDSIPPHTLITQLYRVALPNIPPYNSESKILSDRLSFNPKSKEQIILFKQIANYVANTNIINPEDNNLAYSMLREFGIPHPNMVETQLGMVDDPEYYSGKDYEKLDRLLASDAFLPAIQSMKYWFIDEISLTWYQISSAEGLMRAIKEYYPGVRLYYKDVSIIGSALTGWDMEGGTDFPMAEVDTENFIWQLEIDLKVGELKFRCQKSWAQNWGGDKFPEGTAKRDGDNIPISQAGTYLVTLNLSEGTYTFELLEPK